MTEEKKKKQGTGRVYKQVTIFDRAEIFHFSN